MSKTKIKQRNRLGLNPKTKMLNLMFKNQTHLFSQVQKINSNPNLNELERRYQLTQILEFMEKIKNRLLYRGVKVNPNQHL